METKILLILSCMVLATAAWSLPYYPVPQGPMRYTRFAPPPPPPAHLRLHPLHHHHHHHQTPLHLQPQAQPHLQPQHKTPAESADIEDSKWQRPKRGHDDYDHDHDHDHKGTSGVTGPVHTFVKTDKNANYKWGVRHHVGDKYAS
ncbi:proline-rich protein 7-like [Spodoptera litura]|uniref:Proline-rich protein 7-like n=1 Tax=Spodoptera litura TaxID=69820 RepID=A0A9J7DQT9_SPOLT|nr:proline-rich protein 7-like [Spodoptera litura]